MARMQTRRRGTGPPPPPTRTSTRRRGTGPPPPPANAPARYQQPPSTPPLHNVPSPRRGRGRRPRSNKKRGAGHAHERNWVIYNKKTKRMFNLTEEQNRKPTMMMPGTKLVMPKTNVPRKRDFENPRKRTLKYMGKNAREIERLRHL
jgi:hypothetical protein